ncbi:MAG TPA: hypothetical protein PLK12_17960, partial [Prolixibacteraceae bacterium]|nr:hypothetical protein [Prolixibacteraceae bacterium]
MKKGIFIWVILTGIALQSVFAQNARIKIDLDRTVGEVNPMLYGNFVEHLGRCVYGGIFEENAPLSDERGFRKDVLEAIKGLNVTITRYPGGNFVSNYHWLEISTRITGYGDIQ